MNLQLAVMPREELDSIHAATLEVLNEVGVKFPDGTALKALENVGAEIDFKHMIAHLPEQTIKEALKHAPSKITLCARDPKHDVHLEDRQVHFMPSGIGVYIYDLETGVRRKATRQDTVNVSKIVDALSNIHVLQVMVSPGDVPDKVADHYKFLAGFNNTTKHVSNCIGPITSDDGARDIVRMASYVAGGSDELKKRPLISVHQCPTSPLQYDVHGLRAIMEYARNSIPVAIFSMAMGGGTAPVTLAGELVIINAEFLAGLTLLQALNPHCPVIYGSVASVMDMKTGLLPLGAPERPILQVGVVNLARYYGVPNGMTSVGHTDAKMPGTQAGFEKVLTALPVVLAGANLIFGAGAIDSANTYSYEQLIIDDEIWGALLKVTQGFDVNEETLAVDSIKKVGVGNHFLGERHTLKHVNEYWYPHLYARLKKSENRWNTEILGEKDLAVAARSKAKEILATHQPEPLDQGIHKRIKLAVAKAEKRALH